MNNSPHTSLDWEHDFDKRFIPGNLSGCIKENPNIIKHFIRSLLSDYRKEVENKVREKTYNDLMMQVIYGCEEQRRFHQDTDPENVAIMSAQSNIFKRFQDYKSLPHQSK